jgi:hypothetical protein
VKIYRFNLLLIIILLFISGCFGKSPQVLNNNYDKVQAKIIAVLPIEGKAADSKTTQLFRSRILEELYFKGYSRLPLEVIDKKLEPLYTKDLNGNKISASAVAPQALKDAVGADAGMYCTLTEDNGSKIIYAPIKITLNCELRSAQSGETLWRAKSESTKRNFVFSKKDLEKKSHDDFEIIIDEVVNKILKTLPDGPNLQG